MPTMGMRIDEETRVAIEAERERRARLSGIKPSISTVAVTLIRERLAELQAEAG